MKGIRKKILPELDDAFAKQMGEYETIDQFKEKCASIWRTTSVGAWSRKRKIKLVGSFVERYQFPVPESLLQQQIDARLDRGLRALAAQGMTTEQMRNLDFTRLRTAQRESAMNELRGSLILDRIAAVENIEVADEEMESQLQLLAYQAREPIEALRKRLNEDGGLTRIREQLLREKTVNQLFGGWPPNVFWGIGRWYNQRPTTAREAIR